MSTLSWVLYNTYPHRVQFGKLWVAKPQATARLTIPHTWLYHHGHRQQYNINMFQTIAMRLRPCPVSSTNSSWNSSNFPKSLSPPLISLLIVVADNYELQFVKQGVIQDHGRSYHKCHFDKNYVVLRMS